MADRGNGIRIFNDRATLVKILEEFEDESATDDEEDEEQEPNTAVIISQLRHFVIQVHTVYFDFTTCNPVSILQEYILNPLLIDPREVPIGPDTTKPDILQGHKVCHNNSSHLDMIIFD